MQEEHDAELRLAVSKGFIAPDEVEALRQESRRQSRSPLELLGERGLISEQTLARLRGANERTATLNVVVKPEGAATLKVSSARDNAPSQEAVFPVSGWDRYQAGRLLGQGGMGQVFLAYDPLLRRNIALKFVKGDDAELIRRLLAEARAQARVEHERICQVYEVGEVQGRPYIAMQYVDGRSLSQLSEELTLEQKVLVLREAAEGVQAAHRAGLIHRDLKPSNILVERTEDGRLKPYVMDFGLARDWRDTSNTAPGSVLGTPSYMSPEQARGEVSGLDRRADVYSLGATLYTLLVGEPPISGTNSLEVLNNIATREPRPLRELKPDVPLDLEAIVLKCLEKDRTARYDSVRALIEDLDRFLAGEPVRARPTSAWQRLRRKARKHRLLVGIASSALLAVALALGWAGFTRQQASVRERLARGFTERVERMEALARYSGLSPLHDTRADREQLRQLLAGLEEQIAQAGDLAAGPGHHALGRGYLVLGEDERALKELEAAWAEGFREPRVAASLALVLGRLYQRELLEAARLTDEARRGDRERAAQERYRAPALGYLRQLPLDAASSRASLEVHPDYVQALIAFYEERFDEALSRLDALARASAWFYEVRQLRADIHRARATLRWSQGDRDGALADFEAGRQDYAAASDTARSVLGLALAQGELELTALTMQLYSQGEVLPLHERGREAVRRALVLAPDRPEVRLLEARTYRRLAEFQLNRRENEAADTSIQQALAAAQAALALAPGASQVHLELGRCFGLWGQSLQRQGQTPAPQLQQAEAHLRQVSPEDRDSAYHVQRGILLEARFNYEVEVGPDSLPWLDGAIDAFSEATRLNGKLLNAWLNLANMYRKRAAHPRGVAPDEDLRRARDAAAQARALNPRHSFLFYLEGQIHEQDAWRHRARGEDARPHWTRALELYRQGLALDSRQVHLRNREGSVLRELAREAWERGGAPWALLDEALVAFREALAVSPRDGYSQYNLGEVLLHRAGYERARGASPEASLGALLRGTRPSGAGLKDYSFPRTLEGAAHALRADFALEQGGDPTPHLARAEEALGEALQLNAHDAQALLHRGVLQAVRARWRARRGQGRSEDFMRAAEDFQVAMALEPRQAQDIQVVLGHFCREWASWARTAGQDFETPLKRGLSQAEALLAARPGWAEALVLQASLLALRAQTDAEAVQQGPWRQQAREALRRALTANPQLAPRWKGLLQRLL